MPSIKYDLYVGNDLRPPLFLSCKRIHNRYILAQYNMNVHSNTKVTVSFHRPTSKLFPHLRTGMMVRCEKAPFPPSPSPIRNFSGFLRKILVLFGFYMNKSLSRCLGTCRPVKHVHIFFFLRKHSEIVCTDTSEGFVVIGIAVNNPMLSDTIYHSFVRNYVRFTSLGRY